VKVLIVDDQTQARAGLAHLCGCREDVQVVGEAACGKAALDAVDTLSPDVMLLDVELPDMSGFDLLRAVPADARPLGIMVSKCADHANRAFEEGVLDYVVMPVAANRFDLAMNRARNQLTYAFPGHGRCAWMPRDLRLQMAASPQYLVGERHRKLYPLDPKTIDYIETDGNYVTLRAGKMEYLRRDSIKRLALQLSDIGFIRITRSLLVNAAAVLYAELAGHGTFALTLTSGVCLHSSAAYRDSILRTIPLPALSWPGEDDSP
jgi:two-component system LytT family response regulator